MMRVTHVLLGSLMITGLSASGLAQTQPDLPIISQPNPDSPIGARNPDAPARSQELDFLIGDWDVAIVLHPPEGDDIAYQARWHNSWIVDGHAVMQEWRGPYATGAEFRTYNPQTEQWDGRNYYTFRKAWTASTGEFVDGEFIIETRDTGPNGAFMARERYFDVQPNSFRMSATRSEDDGATWSSVAYEMLCTRLE